MNDRETNGLNEEERPGGLLRNESLPRYEATRRHMGETRDAMGTNDAAERHRDMPGSDRLRQEVIQEVLRDRELPVTLDELTDRIYKWEVTNPGTLYSRQDLREHLYEVDLPALHERGVIVFDQQQGLIDDPRRGVDATDAVASDGETDGRADRVVTGRHYLGTTLLVLATLAAAVGDVGPFAAVPPVAVTGASLLLLSGLGAIDLATE